MSFVSEDVSDDEEQDMSKTVVATNAKTEMPWRDVLGMILIMGIVTL